MYNIQPFYQVVFRAITALKHALNLNKKGLTPWSFSSWQKNNELHKITSKFLAHVQFAAAQKQDGKAWFNNYKKTLVTLETKNKKNIINLIRQTSELVV